MKAVSEYKPNLTLNELDPNLENTFAKKGVFDYRYEDIANPVASADTPVYDFGGDDKYSTGHSTALKTAERKRTREAMKVQEPLAGYKYHSYENEEAVSRFIQNQTETRAPILPVTRFHPH